MRPFHLAVVGICLGMSSAATSGDAAKKDQETLQGSWKVLLVEEEGAKLPEAEIKTMAVKIAGNKITVADKNKVMAEVSFTLDPGKKPKTVDFLQLDGPNKGKTELGIYLIEADKVKFCINGPGKERPTEFASKKNTELGVIVIQRVK